MTDLFSVISDIFKNVSIEEHSEGKCNNSLSLYSRRMWI